MSRTCWSDSPDSHRHSWGTWDRLLDLAEERAGLGPLLDIGCGTGQFLDFARWRGWGPRFGIELSYQAARTARERTNDHIVVADLAKNPMPADHFAAVALWDILEHVPDVRGLLTEVRRVLRPGGVALIGTVHRYGISMRLLRERALTVAPPEHLTFLTSAGLSRAAEDCGLTLSACWSNTVYLREWVRFLPRFASAQVSDPEAYVSCRTNLSAGKLFRFGIACANSVLRSVNLGDELVAIGYRAR
jgi:SAM-dependent methyltransferase